MQFAHREFRFRKRGLQKGADIFRGDRTVARITLNQRRPGGIAPQAGDCLHLRFLRHPGRGFSLCPCRLSIREQTRQCGSIRKPLLTWIDAPLDTSQDRFRQSVRYARILKNNVERWCN